VCVVVCAPGFARGLSVDSAAGAVYRRAEFVNQDPMKTIPLKPLSRILEGALHKSFK